MSAILPTLPPRRPQIGDEPTPRHFDIADRIGIGIGTSNPVYYRCIKTTREGHILQRIDQPEVREKLSHEQVAVLENSEHWRFDSRWFDPNRVETRLRTGADRFGGIPKKELPRVLYRERLCTDFLAEEIAERTTRGDEAMKATIERLDARYREKALADVSRTNVPIVVIKPPSVKTMRRWLDLFESSGGDPMALRDNYRKCGPEADPFDPEVEERLIKHANTYKDFKKPSQFLCWSNLRDELTELNEQRIKAGGDPLEIPTYADMRKAIAEFDAFEVDAARKGIDYARKKYWIVGTGVEATRPGERIEIDEWTVDLHKLLIKSGLWWKINHHHREAAKKQRWVLSAAIDVATKCYLALRLSPTDNAGDPAAATLRMIVSDKSAYATFASCQSAWNMRCGLEMVASDQGSAYTSSVYRSGVLRLGGMVFTPPAGFAHFRPAVERSFGTVRKRAIALFHGQTGSNVIDKGDYGAEAMANLTIEDLAWALIRWVVDCYHNTEHAGLCGKTPANAWKELSQRYGTVPPPDRDTLRNALGTRITRVLDARGVRVLNLHYQSLELQEYRRKVGDGQVEVIVDSDDLGYVSVKLGERGFMSVPCLRPGFNRVTAEDWIEVLTDLRRRFKAEAAIDEDIVRKAMADLQSLSDQSFKRANLGRLILKPYQIDTQEKRMSIAWRPPKDPELAKLDHPPADIFAGVKPAPHAAPSNNDKPDDNEPPAPTSSWTLD